MRHALLVLLLTAVFRAAGAGQEVPDSGKVYPLEEVVITATRSQIPLKDSPSEVEVIGRRAIETANGSTVGDLLRTSSGAFIKAQGAGAALTTLSLRGSASEHVLVLVNGNRYNSLQNGLVDLSLLSLDDVERIEVVHGGNSAFYGADALGGVVNIIMRRAAPGLRLRGEWGGGSYGYGRCMVNAQGHPSAGLGINATYATERGRDDFSYRLSPGAGEAGNTAGRINSDYLMRELALSGDLLTDERSSLTVSLRNVFADRGAPGPVEFASAYARQNDNDVNLDAAYSDAHFDRLNLTLRSGFHYNLERYSNPDFSPPFSSYKNLYAGVGPQVSYLWSPAQKFIAGADLGEGTLVGNDFDSKVTRVQKGVYVSSETRLEAGRETLDRLSFFGTLRYDHVSDAGHAFTPKAGVNVRLFRAGDVRLRASAGKNFRSPSFNDLYYRGFSNPGLRPELSSSMDGGLIASFAAAGMEAGIEATYFYSDTKDRIYFDSRTFRPENIGRVESKGWELKATGRAFGSLLNGSASASLTDAIKKNPTSDGDLTVGNQLPYNPRRQATLSLALDAGTLVMTAVHTIVGSRFVDEANAEELSAYALTSVNAVARHAAGSWQLSLKGEVDNVFAKEYEIFKGYPMPGRTFRLTLGAGIAREE